MAVTQATQFITKMGTTIGFVYYDGRITTSENGTKFECNYSRFVRIDEGTPFEYLRHKIHEKIRARGRMFAEIYYRCPMNTTDGCVRYETMTLKSDNDIQ